MLLKTGTCLTEHFAVEESEPLVDVRQHPGIRVNVEAIYHLEKMLQKN
jgi:hypothetical protein